jgi:tetratricopeptide (TPR) repeat protein
MQNPENTPVLDEKPPAGGIRRFVWMILAAFFGVVLLAGAAGYLSGRQLSASNELAMNQARVTEQFGLALENMSQGQYDVAATRLAYIQTAMPEYPGLQGKIDEANRGMNATPTPQPTATREPSPTPDVSRGEQLLLKAQDQYRNADYRGMYNTLIELKGEIPGFQPVHVDGLLWVALRYEGITLINNGDFTKGAYYLDLAKNYAPLDARSTDRIAWSESILLAYQQAYVDLARVDPTTKDYEQAMLSFENILNLAPGYRDDLLADYIEVLREYGKAQLDQNPCFAMELFEKALFHIPDDAWFTEQWEKARNQCYPPALPTEEFTPTPTP